MEVDGCMPSISVPHSCLNDAHVNVAIEWFSGLITPFLLVAQGLSPRELCIVLYEFIAPSVTSVLQAQPSYKQTHKQVQIMSL
jgi:hypothetical protein